MSQIIKNKLGLLNLAQTLGSVSDACKIFGYSRDSFYRFRELYESGGEQALQEISRRKPNLKNRIGSDIEQAILEYVIEQPAHGQVRVSNELRKRAISVCPATIRNIWKRNNLETFKKRLGALEAKMAQENLILTEDQLKALERKKEEQEAHGEIETEHPGYLGAQDTYYVGTIKGIGRIYQQTFIDTYSKVAFAKLYDRKNALVAAEMLNDRVVPFFEEHQIPLLRILTDRGTEFCGRKKHTNTSSIWPLRISTTHGQKYVTLRATVSVNDSTKQSSKSFIKRHSGRRFTRRWSSSKVILIPGSIITTPTDLILEKYVVVVLPCRRFMNHSIWQRTKCSIAYTRLTSTQPPK